MSGPVDERGGGALPCLVEWGGGSPLLEGNLFSTEYMNISLDICVTYSDVLVFIMKTVFPISLMKIES